jgi:hypothetical protein
LDEHVQGAVVVDVPIQQLAKQLKNLRSVKCEEKQQDLGLAVYCEHYTAKMPETCSDLRPNTLEEDS